MKKYNLLIISMALRLTQKGQKGIKLEGLHNISCITTVKINYNQSWTYKIIIINDDDSEIVNAVIDLVHIMKLLNEHIKIGYDAIVHTA